MELNVVNKIKVTAGKKNFIDAYKKTIENINDSNDTIDREEIEEVLLTKSSSYGDEIEDSVAYHSEQSNTDTNSSKKSFLISKLANNKSKKKFMMQTKRVIKLEDTSAQMVNNSSIADNEIREINDNPEDNVIVLEDSPSKSCITTPKGNRELYILRKTHHESKVLSQYMIGASQKRQKKNYIKTMDIVTNETISSKSSGKDNKPTELSEEIDTPAKKKKAGKNVPLKKGNEPTTKIRSLRTRSASRSACGVLSKTENFEDNSLESWKSYKKLSQSSHNIYNDIKNENRSTNGSPLPYNAMDWLTEEPLNKRTMRSQNQDFVQKQKNFLNRVNHESNDGTDISDCETTVNESVIGGKNNLCANNLLIIEKSWETPNKVGSDGFCWKCHTCGEELLFCSKCPKSFHFKCIKYHSKKTEIWVCSECTTLENFIKQNHKFGKGSLSQDQLNQLLQFALNRVKQSKGYENFVDTPSSVDCPDYKKYITYIVNLNNLQEKISNKEFNTSEEFYIETKWISHNAISYFGNTSKLARISKNLVKIFRQETNEIETCYECYYNANKRNDWFVEICTKPHIIVWAKLKGFPYWPAKAMQFNPPSTVNVRFFGEHDRSNVSIKEVYLYSKENPNPQTKQGKNSKNTIAECIKEVEIYIEKIINKFGKFNYAKIKTPYNPMEDQLELMIPGINEYLKKKTKPQINQIQPQQTKPEIKLTYKIVKTADDNLSFVVKTNSEVNSQSTLKSQFRNCVGIIPTSLIEIQDEPPLTMNKTYNYNNAASTSGHNSLDSIKKNQDEGKKQNDHRNTKNIKEIKNNSEKQRIFEAKEDFKQSYEVVSKNPSDDIKKIQSLVIKRRYDGNSSSSSESVVTAENKRLKVPAENSNSIAITNYENTIQTSTENNTNGSSIKTPSLKRQKSDDSNNKTLPNKLQKIVTDNSPPPLVLLNTMEANSTVSVDDNIIDNTTDKAVIDSEKDATIIKSYNKGLKCKTLHNLMDKGKSMRIMGATKNNESIKLASPILIKNKKTPHDLKEKSNSMINLKSSTESNVLQKRKSLLKSPENAYFPIPFIIKEEIVEESDVSVNNIINNSVEPEVAPNCKTSNQIDQNQQDLSNQVITAVNKNQIPFTSHVKAESFSAEEICDKTDSLKTAQRISVRDLGSLQQVPSLRTGIKDKEYQKAKKSFPNKPTLQTSERNSNNMVYIPGSGVLLQPQSQINKIQSSSLSATNFQQRPRFISNNNFQTSTSHNNVTSNTSSQPQNVIIRQNEVSSANSVNNNAEGEAILLSNSSITPNKTSTVSEFNALTLPKLVPRPKISFNSTSDSVFPIEAGPVCQKLMENAHIMTDFFRSVIENTLADIADNGNLLEAKVKMLELKLEKQKYHHERELNEIRQNMEKEKNEIRKQTEIERIKAIEETKKKQWCFLCGKEAHFYCCWNTSYCDYSCQQKHWPRHMTNCKQNNISPTNSSVNGATSRIGVEITPYNTKDKSLNRVKNKEQSNISSITPGQIMPPRIITPATFARQPIAQKLRPQNTIIPRFNIPVPLNNNSQPFSIQVLDGNWELINSQNSTGNLLNPITYQQTRIATNLNDGISNLIIPCDSNNSNTASNSISTNAARNTM